MGDDTTLGYDDVTEELIQLFVVPDGELQVTRHDTLFLVITSGVTSEFENLGCEVFEDGREVDGSSRTNTLSIVALLQETMHTTNGELETRLGRARLRLATITASLAASLSGFATFSRHCCVSWLLGRG